MFGRVNALTDLTLDTPPPLIPAALDPFVTKPAPTALRSLNPITHGYARGMTKFCELFRILNVLYHALIILYSAPYLYFLPQSSP